jgi:hypothetical protein
LYAFVIHDLLRRFLRPDARRAVGLLLVAALFVLAVAGAAHASGGGHDDDACSVCDAVLRIAGAAIAAPQPTLHAPEAIEHAAPDVATPILSFEPAFVHAPRGPPVRA